MQSHQLKKGQIVRSIAGRDKGKFYLIVAWEDDIVWVADGRQKTLSKPKRKNLSHLWCTKDVVLCEDDATVRATLDAFLISPK